MRHLGRYDRWHHSGGVPAVSWVASLEVRSEDGIWYIASSQHPTRTTAWAWLQSKMIHCCKARLKYRHTKIAQAPKVDPDQFSFLQGDDCAREWQDSALVRGRK